MERRDFVLHHAAGGASGVIQSVF
ncbi:twin-arginine translocation signal domain-containing protein [Enterobacter sp.]